MYSLLEECTLNEGAKTLETLKANLDLIARCGETHLERASVTSGYMQRNSLDCLNQITQLINDLIKNQGK